MKFRLRKSIIKARGLSGDRGASGETPSPRGASQFSPCACGGRRGVYMDGEEPAPPKAAGRYGKEGVMDANALHKLSYGMYVVASGGPGDCNAQIANTVFQITSAPPALGLSINKLNYTHEFLEKSGVFSISVLSEEADMRFIGRFGFRCGRDFPKMEGVQFRTGVTGAPIITEKTCAFLEGKVTGSLDCGTHTLFLGEVLEAGILNEQPPMTYAHYHQVKNGKSPGTAPTYIG